MKNLLELAAQIAADSVRVRLVEQAVIEKAADILEKGIIANIGTSKFTPLAPSTVTKKGHSLQLLDTGELKGSIGKTIGKREAWIGSTDKVAAYQEWGTSHVPPRPFILTALKENIGPIERMAAKSVLSKMGNGHGAHNHGWEHTLHDIAEIVEHHWDKWMR